MTSSQAPPYVLRVRNTFARKRANLFLAGTVGTVGTPQSGVSISLIGDSFEMNFCPTLNLCYPGHSGQIPILTRSRADVVYEKEDRSSLACVYREAIRV